MGNIAIIIEALLRSLIYVLFPSRRAQEVLMLRKELQILKRQVKKPRFTDGDKLLIVALSRLRWRVTQRLVTIRPETVLRWHRALVAGKWDFSRARIGRPVITDDIRLLVVEMKKNNPRWGLRRIKGELRKIGVSLSKSSISNILNTAGYPPRRHGRNDVLAALVAHYATNSPILGIPLSSRQETNRN